MSRLFFFFFFFSGEPSISSESLMDIIFAFPFPSPPPPRISMHLSILTGSKKIRVIKYHVMLRVSMGTDSQFHVRAHK